MNFVAILRLLVELAAPSRPPDGRVSASEVAPVPSGAAVELSVTILDTPMAGMPLELWLHSADLVLDHNRFDNRDIVDPLATQPRVRARLVAPTQPGRYGVDARVVYVTCGARTCRSRRALVHWDLEVTAPLAASGR